MDTTTFPCVRQLNGYDCGPTCLTSFYLWLDLIPPDFMHLVNEDGMLDGADGIFRELEKLGPTRRDHTLSCFPLFCLIWDGCEHWVVALHFNGSSVWYMDPEIAEVVVSPIEQFEARWSDPRLSEKYVGIFCDAHQP